LLRRLEYKVADEEEKGSVCIVTRAGSSLRTRNKSVQRWAATWMLSRNGVRGHLASANLRQPRSPELDRGKLRG
jgi:hypothetical protein